MEQRVVLFLILSVVIIFSYPILLQKMGVPVVQTQTAEPTKQEEKTKAIASHPVSEPSVNPPSSGTVPAASVAQIEKVVETDLYRVVLSSAGGTIKKWELKRYTEKDLEGKEHPIELIKNGYKSLPLDIREISNPAKTVLYYSMDAEGIRLDDKKPEAVVQMVHLGPDGHKIKKELRFYNDDYRIDLNVYHEGAAKEYAISLGTNFGIHTIGGKNFLGGAGAIGLVGDEVVKVDFSKTEGNPFTFQGIPKWFALNDKYFIGAMIPQGKERLGPVSVRKVNDNQFDVDIKISPKNGETLSFILYAGPKEHERLSKFKVYMEESIDFGWFIAGSWLPVRLVAKPLFYILQWLYSLIHNYGVAIIILTLFVKVLFFPLTKKSLSSMKSMAAMQPKVAAIRKQWEKNKERMNKELMNLYKEENINPLGGCLPMLMQMPVFIALFNVLNVTIELRQAPFMFWIQDLSDKDPYYVLPIVMGVSMFFQQLTQPNTMDPVQAKIMLFMPVIYTFFFLNFPSGLVLYWLVNNILSIGQQYYMNKEGLSLQKA